MKQQKHHSVPEDIFAIATAALFVGLGVYLFKYCGFLTGGVAGLALILHQVTDFTFGQIFFVMNLPFYYLAWTRMGKRFTLNTFISVSIVSFVADNLSSVITINSINPFYAAVLGGLLMGTGILIMFRHVSSLGGLGVAAKFLQDRDIVSAGRFLIVVDSIIVLIGFFIVDFETLLMSVGGALVMNLLIMINHKPGRYQIT